MADTLLQRSLSYDADVTRPEHMALPPGTRIGRFVIRGLLGAGAMGIVHEAEDPELHRPVALKCVRPDDPDVERAQERLRREARAMAQLSDPNVVRVHDVVVHEGRVYVAMELLDGGSLAAWLAQGRRTWREILGAFMQAGRGLAAAHEIGLVHRDFKPENVLRSRHGRVCVTDFGLACPSGRVRNAEGNATTGHVASGSGDRWTTSREIAGTPDYMAPEQASGAPADARSDQFSFCVALYEALFGDDPLRACAVVPPGRESPIDVPLWVSGVLLRGLRALPEERYDSMAALLEELAPERRSQREVRFSDPTVIRKWLGRR